MPSTVRQLALVCALLGLAWWPTCGLAAASDGVVWLVASGPGFARILYRAATPAPAGSHLPAAALHPFIETALVGVPLDGDVELAVLEAHIGAHLADTELPEDLGLQGPVALGEPAMLRHQRVVGLTFTPARNADGGVVIFDRVLVELRFADVPGSPGPTDRFETSYRATLTNYEQARAWRQPRQVARRATQTGVLPAEGMVRLVVRSNGMYRVTGAQLEEAGVNLRRVAPARMRVLYGGGLALKRAHQVSPGITLRPIPIVIEDGDDGRFGKDDYVLFYGEGVERWDYGNDVGYLWRSNLYTRDNVYWLDLEADGNAPRTARRSAAVGDAATVVEQYRERLHEEDDRFILRQLTGINTGYDWFWEAFTGNARNFTVGIAGAVAGAPVAIRARFWGWTNETHFFDVLWNARTLARVRFEGSDASTVEVEAVGGAVDGLNQLGLFHRSATQTRLDWYEVEYIRQLAARSGELVFDWPSAEDGGVAMDSTGGVAQFRLRGFPAADGRPRVFEISTGMQELVDFEHDGAAGTVAFAYHYGGTGRPPRFVVTQAPRWKRPAAIAIDTQDRLRDPANDAEYVVISHGDFLGAAQRLAAWRAVDDRFGTPLTTKVVDVQDIYDEFSGGLLDPMAIRAFINHAVDNWAVAPVYITLIGDGTYDYKNNSGVSHTNWMPPYEDGQSMYDEWYVRIEGEDVVPDLAIGRLPAQTAGEADAMVDKIITYDRSPEPGPWQAEMLLVADDIVNPQAPDDYESYFLIDAEDIADRGLPQDLDLTKLYVGSYHLEGRTKPRARDEFVRQFNDGALLLTYIGHGNPEVLAHEQIFLLSRDIEAIDNGGRLPFIYTAASQVGVFDDPMRESMPETLVKMADGGAIGFISATRIGFHNSNMVLARQFHVQMYRSGREHVPVGLALMEAKQMVSVNTEFRLNIQRYSLLGDAAQRLARPRLSVALDLPDTLEALMEVEMTGTVLGPDGQPRADYDGRALVRVYDSNAESLVEGLAYNQVGTPIFRGRVAVEGGRFGTRFRVPKDITYRAAQGRASAYVVTDDGSEPAFGSKGQLRLEGTAARIEIDEEGPSIALAFDGNTGFRTGDYVSPRPVLTAAVADPSGVNVTGETGHQIELRIDDEVTTVTEFYTSIGDHQQGIVEYPIDELAPGEHTIRLKAWDSYNNSSVATAAFVVAEETATALTDVLFHPNPAPAGSGHFSFTLTAPPATARVRVFALSGRLMAEIEAAASLGYNQVRWDHPDLANGTYLYRLEARLESGAQVSHRGWIQVAR